jgi:adenosine deaminase
MSDLMIDPRLPLIDLHRHLDGSVRLATILELGQRHGVKLPGATLEGLRRHVQIVERQPGVMAFIAKMLWMTAVLA